MERCVLVVDDNPEMLTMTHNAWAQQGYAQRCVKTGEEAVGNLISAQKFKRDFRLIALVADYLDERLIPMVKLVRHISDLPLLVLSSEYHAGIRTEAFLLGADRYLPIPDTIDEGIVTGLAMIRMCERYTGAHHQSAILFPRDFYISADERRVLYQGREIRLTRKEFDLLWYLAINQNITLNHEQIYEEVWGDEYCGDSNKLIWSMVSRLREKLGDDGKPFAYIRSERNVGYRLEI